MQLIKLIQMRIIFLVEVVLLQLPPDFVLFINTISAMELHTPFFICAFL